MLGKRKATAAALEVGKKPKNHGGKRQGTGPKPTPTNAPGSDAPDAPKRKQATLSDLLGARREAQKKTTETEAVVVVDLDAEEAPHSHPAGESGGGESGGGESGGGEPRGGEPVSVACGCRCGR